MQSLHRSARRGIGESRASAEHGILLGNDRVGGNQVEIVFFAERGQKKALDSRSLFFFGFFSNPPEKAEMNVPPNLKSPEISRAAPRSL